MIITSKNNPEIAQFFRDFNFSFTEQTPHLMFRLYVESGKLFELFPWFIGIKVMKQNQLYHPEVYVYSHIYECLERYSKNHTEAGYHILFHDIGKPLAATRKEDADYSTFYDHDIIGAHLFNDIADAYNFGVYMTEHKLRTIYIAIRMHMLAYRLQNLNKIDNYIEKYNLLAFYNKEHTPDSFTNILLYDKYNATVEEVNEMPLIKKLNQMLSK